MTKSKTDKPQGVKYLIGSVKTLYKKLDSKICYRIRMCNWKHWKAPQNRVKNLTKLGILSWSAWKSVYLKGYAKLGYCRDVYMAVSNDRLASFGLISMLNYKCQGYSVTIMIKFYYHYPSILEFVIELRKEG